MGINDMTNKVAVITGGTRGLGRETAVAFHENAYRVVVCYVRSGEAAHGPEAPGDEISAVKADVGCAGDVSGLCEFVRKKWGRVDVLVNNAGVTGDSLLIRQKEAEWDEIINTNLKGAFNTIRFFAPLMAGGGHIINISSYSGLKGREGQAAYSASKAALLGLTKTAALELAGNNIRVNAVLPGYMPTEMGLGAGEPLKRAREESLLNTLSDPKEVAGFILYLAGTKNITGQIFCLDSRIV